MDNCINIWNSSLIIKDTDLGINNCYRFENFVHFLLKEVDKTLLDELFIYVLDEISKASIDEKNK